MYGLREVTAEFAVIPSLAITPTTLPNGGVNVAYSKTISATGGTGTYLWSATGLPTGLSINPSTGEISGTPGNVVSNATFAIFSVVISVQDSAVIPGTATTTLNLRINQTAPAAPSGVSATAPTSTQVVLTWTDNANNETAITVQRATDVTFTSNLTNFTSSGTTLTTYTDNTVVTGTTYYYRVRAVNYLTGSAYVAAPAVTTP